MKTIKFSKMHGIGNDYIYINCMTATINNPSSLAKRMSPRHFSVGSDGVVLICPSDKADAKMRMFNADGSEGKMCGNAIRCIGKYLYERKITDKKIVKIETLSGIKTLHLNVTGNKVDSVSVDMGYAILNPKEIPVKYDGGRMIDAPVDVLGKTYKITAVSMGNPHAVIFADDVNDIELEKVGPLFENLEIFPDRVNTEFVKVVDSNTLEMRVWERGSGETYACGTGACAVVAAAVLCGHCGVGHPITVRLIGGELKIICASDMKITMEGPAEFVYDGEYFLD